MTQQSQSMKIKTQLRQRVYFSVADQQLSNFLGEESFSKSLVLNSLFQQGIIIPDIFFVISRYIEKHVMKSDSRSFLEACLASNIIVPAFRNSSCQSFYDALYEIQGSGKPRMSIQGVLPDADKIVDRLQLAIDSNMAFSPAYWPPQDLGERFESLILKYLSVSDSPKLEANTGSTYTQERLDRAWEISAPWRLDCIEQALKRTNEIAGSGIRRGEIMNAVARNLGFPENCRIDDMSEIIEVPTISSETKEALSLYFRWVCLLYHYNQASEFNNVSSRGFNTSLNFPDMAPEVFSLLSSNSNVAGEAEASNYRTINETIRIPPIASILNIPGNELVEIRNDLGAAYFSALTAWRRAPTENAEQEVRDTLQSYAKAIYRTVSKRVSIKDRAVDVLLGTRLSSIKHQVDFGLGLLGFAVPFIFPSVPIYIGAFLALAPLGYDIYRWRPDSKENIILSRNNSLATVQPETNISVEPVE